MSNLQPQQFQQLKMFMTPREVVDEYRPLEGDTGEGESETAVWSRKLRESQVNAADWANIRAQTFVPHSESDPEASLFESVKKEGVKHPVRLGQRRGPENKPEVVGGHHRIASALFSRPDDLMPVLHDTSTMGAMRSPGYRYR